MIDPFPGTLAKVGRHLTLNPEQEQWLRKWHPVTENKVLEKVSGIKHTTLARFIRKMGLSKDGEGLKEIMRRKGEKQRETYLSEKRRKIWGMEQRTKLYVPMRKYTVAQLSCRMHALEKGYVLAADCREGSPGRWTIFYDQDTPRDETFERNCRKNHFDVREWQDDN